MEIDDLHMEIMTALSQVFLAEVCNLKGKERTMKTKLCFLQDREAGFSQRPELPLPTKPPFTAHIGNLSFDAAEAEISDFFADCSVSNVRLVRDKMEDRPKGFGYVEFETLDGLKKALDLNNAQLAGRKVRISVADPRKLLITVIVFWQWILILYKPFSKGSCRRR